MPKLKCPCCKSAKRSVCSVCDGTKIVYKHNGVVYPGTDEGLRKVNEAILRTQELSDGDFKSGQRQSDLAPSPNSA